MHCERIEITQAHRPGGITPRRGLLLPCRVGAVVWVYAVRRSVGRCTAFLCCGGVVYPCTVPGVLWAVCGAVDVALRRLPTFLPKKDFTDFFKESETEHRPSEVLRFVCKLSTSIQQNQHHQRRTGGTAYTSKTSHSKPRQIAPARTTPPGTVQSHQHIENTSDFITHFQANFSDFPGLVLFPPA